MRVELCKASKHCLQLEGGQVAAFAMTIRQSYGGPLIVLRFVSLRRSLFRLQPEIQLEIHRCPRASSLTRIAPY